MFRKTVEYIEQYWIKEKKVSCNQFDAFDSDIYSHSQEEKNYSSHK